MSISSVRNPTDRATVSQNLGLLAELAGSWKGKGFNLVARPDFADKANLFLELNLTEESLTFEPISSSIPNRGFAQADIELFGLTYLQKITDRTTGGALHIEPGIWITQTTPPFLPVPSGDQIVARMGNIPHGNSLLAQGVASRFEGPPVISPGAAPLSGGNPKFSSFPSFNSTPIAFIPQAITPGNPIPKTIPVFPAAGTAESTSVAGGGFTQYNLANPAEPVTNPRTPLDNTPPVLPPAITQQIVNDPIILLQQTIQQQIADGYSFKEGVALNISTEASLTFNTQPIVQPNQTTSPTTIVTLPQFAGGIENTPFLQANAVTVLVYATFWLTKLTHPTRPTFHQLQYAQMVVLNFPAAKVIVPPATEPSNFGWPHVSVATLHKSFG